MSSIDAASMAKIIEELGEVSRDLWNAGKLNSQARALERIAEELGVARNAALEAARLACIEMIGGLQRGAYREACLNCAEAIQQLKNEAPKLAEVNEGKQNV